MKKEANLNSFLNPKSIAVIGASNEEGKVGNILMKKLKAFKGKVIPINKNNKIIEKKQSYKKISDYKKNIDLAVIATPAKTIPKILEQCGKKQIKNIIIISAGFSEIGNFNLEKKIINLKYKYDLNILGPNCFGIINTRKNLDLTFSKKSPEKGETAFISQSGALGSYIIDKKVKLSGFISVGNMSDLNFSDFIEYFSKDKNTNKIVLYIESLKQGKKFIETCKSVKKPIIVVKSGKTKKGKEATMSHTGSLATDEEIYKGAFKQAKVKEATSLTKAFGFNEQKIKYYLKGKNIAIITNAGGAGALLVDQLEEHSIHGPLDLLGTATSQDYEEALNKLNPRKFDSIIVTLTPQYMSEIKKTAQIISNYKYKDKIVACFLGEDSIQEAIEIFKKNKISYLTSCV